MVNSENNYYIILYMLLCSDFRPAYSELDSITAQLPGAAVLALTASATPSTIDEICKSLCMLDPVLITANPNHANIIYAVARKKPDIEEE